MNNISLGNYPVYDPPPGSPFCNFFEETAGCSRYGYGIFCMLAKDYKALLDAHATVVRLIMTAPHGTSTDAQFKMERDVVLGRARFLSSDVGDVKNSTFTHTFVNVVVYDLTFFLNTNDTQHVFVNVVNTTSTDMSTDATVYYPSTLNGGTAQHDWSDIWSTFTLTTPASGDRKSVV